MLRAAVFPLGVTLATQVILCVTVIGNIGLFTIVLKERPSLIRTVFALYVVSIAAWAFTIYANLFLKSLLVEDWIFAIAAGTLTSQLWFAKLFPVGRAPVNLRGYWPLAIGYFFMVASFYPNALFTSITIHPQGYTILDTGPLSTAYSLFALLYVFAPIFIFFRKYRREPNEKLRRQLGYLTVGFFVFATIAVLTNSVLPVFFHLYTLNAVGPAFSLIFASVVFYIIGRHEFLDIRRAVQRGVIYSFLIAIIVAGYATLLILVDRDFSLKSDAAEPISAATATVIGIMTIPLIERYFQKITDRIFFKGHYDYAFALQSLSGILHRSTNYDELIQRMQQSLSDILRAESVQIILYGKDARSDVQDKYATELAARAALFEPISIDTKEIGGILVKEKLSGDSYRMEDIQLLRTFSLQASTALARAQLFLQVQRHAVELEGKVAERTDELRAVQERERHMMQDIAHSLQTPLAVFQTKLETLRSSDREAMNVDAFENSLTQLSDFIGNLLTLAHLENSGSIHVSEHCSLSNLVNEIADEVEIIAASRDIRVRRAVMPQVEISAHAKDLRSAITNLASNSIKYMRADGIREIVFSLMKDGRDARLEIRDTGIGITESELPHIFDRFYRADSANAAKGTGLGLAISRRIIENHRGSLNVESVIGKGTTMTIQLRLAIKAP